MRYRVTTPAEGHTGIVAGVPFRQGVGELETGTDAARAALAYFRRRGYGVESITEAAPAVRPAQSASVADWRAYAVACGATQDQADAATKAQLIEQYGRDA